MTDDLVEREHELAALRARLTRAAGGEGGVALIEGPAGIGKTRLLAELRAHAAATGVRVLHARAGELEREFGFGVVRQLFEAAARERPPSGAAAGALPVLGAPGEAADPEGSFGALHGLYWLALDLAADGPLLLAVDDLHWCDRPSLRFLAYLARRLEGQPLLVAGTLRTTEPGTDPALLGELAVEADAVTPRPLTGDGAAALVQEALGAAPDPAFTEACATATGGNPLLLRQLLRALATEGVPPDAAHVERVRGLGASAVSRTVLLRLARLPADAIAVARAVATLGDAAPLPAVVALAGLDPARVAAATGELARAEILGAGAPLGFVHALVRDAVHLDMPPAERELLHARAAAELRALGAPAEQVAAQLLATSPAGDPATVATLREAATAAVARGGADSAVALLRRALAEPPAPDRRGAVLADLGRAETLVDGPAAAAHLAEALPLVGDLRERAGVAERLAKVLAFTGRLDESVAVAERAAAEAGPGDEATRHRLRALMALAAHFAADDVALERLRARFPDEDPGPDAGTRMSAVVAATELVLTAQPADQAVALTVNALAGDALWDADDGVFTVGGLRVLALCDHPGSLDYAERCHAEAHRRGSTFGLLAALLWHGVALLRRGELQDAEAALRHSVAEGERWSIGPGADPFAVPMLARTLLEQGRVAEARAVLDGVPLPPFRFEGVRWWRGVDLLVLVAEGRHAEAVDAAELVERDFPRVVNPVALGWRGPKARALHGLGRADEALALAEQDVEVARRFGAPGAVGGALRVRGLLRGGAEGLADLEEAARLLDGSVARLEHAKALAALGAALRRDRRPTDAREPLRAALELAAACGADGLAEEVRGELRAAGARPRTDALTGAGALTASERRVAGLAAQGRSNREIAQALFVTPKTVELHLSNAYRKLGIRSRRELPEDL